MSDIWNEFEKIAVEQGLVITAEEDRKQEDPSKMPARYDSISDDAIRLLYGVEPETIFEKNKTIIEIAHPETAVVSRTYDAMNAVVENLHQRQDMMAYIALKMPNGHLTQRRYVAAKQDLVNSLVRAAFLLENKDEEDLVTLADSCAERLVKNADDNNHIVKEALGPLAIAGIAAGVGSLLGVANYFINGAPTAQNVYANAQIAMQALEPLMAEPYAKGIAGNLKELMNRSKQIHGLRNSLVNIQSVGTAVSVVQNNAGASSKINAQIQSYLEYLQAFYEAIPGWVQTIQRASKVSTEVESDWYKKLTDAVDYVWDNDEKTLVKALAGEKAWFGLGGQQGGLLEAIKNDIAAWTSQIQGGQQQVQQAVAQIGNPQPQASAQPAQVAQTPAQAPQQQYLIPGGLPQASQAPAAQAPGAARQQPEAETFYGLPLS